MPMLLGYNNYVLPEADMWHPAVFKGIEKTDSKFGPRYKWKFELISDDEELDGNPIHGNTSQSVSEKSHAGKFFFLPMTEMTDEEASELGDEKIDFEDFEGDQFEVYVEHNETDKGTFANVTKVKKPKVRAKVGKASGGKKKPAEDPLGDDVMPGASNVGDDDIESDIPI